MIGGGARKMVEEAMAMRIPRKNLRTGNSGYCDLCNGLGAAVEFVGSFQIYVCEQGHEWLGPNSLEPRP